MDDSHHSRPDGEDEEEEEELAVDETVHLSSLTTPFAKLTYVRATKPSKTQ
jgi:hypothetical protein